MSKEAFNELIDGLEYVESLTEYGRKNIKYHVQKLQQENKKLNGAIQTYDILLKSNIEENQQLKIQISAREEEYKKLEDNWNELKKFALEKQVILFGIEYACYSDILDKMQELEKGDSNE